MTRLRYNGLNAALSGSHSNSTTTLTLAAALTHSNGTNVPTITGSDYIPLEILDSTGHLSEIVYLTAYTAGATTGTITRGREGTSGVSHSSGDKVVCAVTTQDVGVWTAYTPTWTAASVNPTLGNGTIDGQYCQIGDTVHIKIRLVFGSTTTAGTGVYQFTIPVNAYGSSGDPILHAGVEDVGTRYVAGQARIGTSSGVLDILYSTVSGSTVSAAQVTNSAPFTFGNTDRIFVSGSYRAA